MGYREVFFATDRKRIAEGSFENSANDSGDVAYGRTIVSIPATHLTGELERPWTLFTIQLREDAASHILIAKRELLPSDSFFTEVNHSIDVSPEGSAFVFVHGYNVSFDEAILRTGQLAWDLRFRGPAITYSWPSADRTGKYLDDIEMAEWTAPHLRKFLEEVRRQTGTRTVHLIAHSMGSRVLGLALQEPDAAMHFQEIVLAAPDIGPDLFSQLGGAMEADSERVTIYSSRRDVALKLSTLLREGTSRIGKQVAGLRGADVIDATRVSTSLLGHSYFADSPLILNDLALLLKRRLAPAERSVTLIMSGAVWAFR
jgi:esterase/lipase superfamily enzyme